MISFMILTDLAVHTVVVVAVEGIPPVVEESVAGWGMQRLVEHQVVPREAASRLALDYSPRNQYLRCYLEYLICAGDFVLGL